MTVPWKYLFGPVPSRRLGMSLGIDIVPLKTCTQNCVYCQLGIHGRQILQRQCYVPVTQVVEELRQWIAQGGKADFITISGSGEPTLHSEFGILIDQIRTITSIPVAVITNGTLLSDPDVRAACCKADVVLPSLDAGDAATFERINRPHPDLDFNRFVDGLVQFRNQYKGQLWLEVFLVEGVNTDNSRLDQLRQIIQSIRPDKIQVNTAVRPTAEPNIVRVEPNRLQDLARRLGEAAEVIADFDRQSAAGQLITDMESILETLRRRPCTLDDLSNTLLRDRDLLADLLDGLLKHGKIRSEVRGTVMYYKI